MCNRGCKCRLSKGRPYKWYKQPQILKIMLPESLDSDSAQGSRNRLAHHSDESPFIPNSEMALYESEKSSHACGVGRLSFMINPPERAHELYTTRFDRDSPGSFAPASICLGSYPALVGMNPISLSTGSDRLLSMGRGELLVAGM